MPDPTPGETAYAVLHDVQALRAAQRAAQEAIQGPTALKLRYDLQPLILEMAQLYTLYTTSRWLCGQDTLSGVMTVEQVETVWTNADAEALYQQYAAMVRQMLENPRHA